jgi:tripartite-type tricarboxylate transporter receptor subunit TctC
MFASPKGNPMKALIGIVKLLTFCAAMAAAPMLQAQETYPSRPIKMVIPYPPGGTTDVVGRHIAQELGTELGQPIVIDNKGGASGDIGSKLVATSPPDGYTLLFVPMGTFAVNPHISKNSTINPLKDFVPIARVADASVVIVVNSSVPAKSLAELIALAKSKPGSLNYGSSGSGGTPHLAGEIFKSTAKVDVVHVPYKGGGPALVGLLAGDVSVMFTMLPSAAGHIKAGKIRTLAVTSSKRSAAFPDIPTTAELGFPSFDVLEWYAIFGPSGMDPAKVQLISSAMNKVLAKPSVLKFIADNGLEPGSGTPEQLGALVRDDYAKFGRVVTEAGVKAD